MTTFTEQADLTRNSQDSTERHVFGEVKFEKNAPIVSVKGNGTEDSEFAVLTIGGVIMHLPKDTNAEVVMLGGGDDTTAKLAVILGPRDKVYQAKEGETWHQDPMNPDERHGFTENGIRSKSKSIGIGAAGQIEVVDGAVYLRGTIYTEQPIVIGSKPFQP